MKSTMASKTIWAAIALPITGWGIQHWNGGMLPMFVQTWGPLVVAVGFALLRCSTTEACRICDISRK